MPTLLIGLAFFLWPSSSSKNDELSLFSEAPKQLSNNQHRHDDHSKSTHTSSLSEDKISQVIPNQKNEASRHKTSHLADFQAEKESLRKLAEKAKTSPEALDELIVIALGEDFYKERGQEPKPHSLNEIKQNQQGALKVMALQGIVKSSKNRSTTASNLNRIISESKDPTIRKIAKAMLDSHKKGRSFVKDFGDGVLNQGLPTDD
jgi:HD superfamily phosphohydrolase